MNFKNNFLSFVILGNFNPSILTNEFITNICNIKLKEGKYNTPLELPFPREIYFQEEKLLFTIDLERLQIKETEINDLKTSRCIEIAKTYLDKLPYTPLFAAGLNFNYQIEIDENEEDVLNSYLDKKEDLYKIFNIDEFDLRTYKKFIKSQKSYNIEWNLSFPIKKTFITSLNIKRITNNYLLNHNIEVKELKKKSENLKILIDDYINILNLHDEIMKNFLKGFKDES